MQRLMAAALLALFAFVGHANAQIAGIAPCAAESLAVSGTSSNVALSACGPVVIVYNITSQEAFYNLGQASNTAATATSYSLPGNSFVVLQVGQSTPGFLAAIASTGTTTKLLPGRL